MEVEASTEYGYEKIPGADFKGWFRVIICFAGSLTHAYVVLSILIRGWQIIKLFYRKIV